MLLALERWVGRSFGRANPWHFLGALSFQMFWIVAVSGIYLFAAFDTSVAGAYRSVQSITHEQWYLGGVMRSLHRYASDAFVVAMTLHLLKELLQGHFSGFRRFSWLTGIPLVWLTYAAGIGGYWLVWDQLAQFSITATAEWLDALPFGADTVARNFLAEVDDRFFSLLIFLHIGIPLLLLLGMWIHIQRIGAPRTFPPRELAAAAFATLLGLALAMPVHSHAPAEFGIVPAALGLDWFYMFVHPLQYATSPQWLWGLAGVATLALAALPLIARGRQEPIAVVSAANCNGCGRCFNDCPYAAIRLDPHPNARAGQRIAVVAPELCAACGICAGACPSSTPFRSTEALITGIDMPALPIDAVRARLEEALHACASAAPIVIFACMRGARPAPPLAEDTVVTEVACSAMLPPSFVEYALRGGAAGVLVVSCPGGECEFRTGPDLLAERFAGERVPHLRDNVPRDRVEIVWAGSGQQASIEDALARMRAAIDARPPDRRVARRGKRARARV